MTATTSHLAAIASSSSSSPAPPLHTTPKPSRTRPSPHSSPQQPPFGSPRSGSPKSIPAGTLDVETIIRSHGGDLKKALEVVISDRNNLQAQNSQLWKLIEKQRAQCASLAGDNERLRADRERANSKLTSAGLEPINGKRMPNSSSAVGLGFKAEQHPLIRRHNSDRDEKSSERSTQLQVPATPTAPAPTAPTSTAPPPEPLPVRSSSAGTTLLPSPIVAQDVKLRRESRMAFPPEVSSFMTLADSPRDMHHTIPPSLSNTTLSPSSQYSASPGGVPTFTASIPPPSAPSFAVEPPALSRVLTPPPRVDSLSPVASTHESFIPSPSEESVPSSLPDTTPAPQYAEELTPRPTPETVDKIPLLWPSNRLAPALLSHTRLSIPNSTVSSNALGRDVLCFIVNVSVRPPNAQPTSWNVSKLFSAFIDLDTKIKAKSGKNRKEWKNMVASLPEGRAWKDFAPSKIDQRKSALEAYIQSLLIAPLSDKSDLCDFLSTDRVQAKANAAKKEGYLTKKGKNFGGWKTRYFVLEGPVMEYYESRGGTHLGSIVITNAQIGRQNRPSESSDERDFRHAFLIIEQARKGGLRHVLCAESDSERDSWIEVLVRYVMPEAPPVIIDNPSPPAQAQGLNRKRSTSRKSSKDVVVTAAQPLSAMPGAESKFGGAPSPSLFNSMESKRLTQSNVSIPSMASQSSLNPPPPYSGQAHTNRSVSASDNPPAAPTAAAVAASSSSSSEATPRNVKRQSMMPIRASASTSQSHSAAFLNKVASEGGLGVPELKERDRKAKSGRFWPSFGKTPEIASRPVFGVPLSDSIAVASKANLPAIVFRCIEYLEAKKAEQEEGIYRLSGSSAVIKGLKDRFDLEGDVNLLQVDEHWDPHAIAGLLKTFLRDLPNSLLTRDLHPRFLAVMDLIDSSARVSELSRLVSELPPPNYALLRALTAHLILIVKNSTLNKMTLRNIGIVFSPTLGIPAGIFSELVSHFGPIFDNEDESELISVAPSEESGTLQPQSSEETEETVRRKRNSMLYQAGGADLMLGLGGRALDPALEDSSSDDEESDAGQSETPSFVSEENTSTDHATPRAEGYPSAAAVRKAKAAARATDKGLTVDPSIFNEQGGQGELKSPARSDGLPNSPKPSAG